MKVARSFVLLGLYLCFNAIIPTYAFTWITNEGRKLTKGRCLRLNVSLKSASSADAQPKRAAAVRGPPLDTKPDYETIIGPLGKSMDYIFLTVFRNKLSKETGIESPVQGYAGMIDIALQMNIKYPRQQVQKKALLVLLSLFPSWMPGAYAKLFSEPFPAFSSRMNAWATLVAGTWLMGECEINDIVIDGTIAPKQGLLVKRCRFLEESGCASVCVHACKLPTQTFFAEHMGLPLSMEPNYETFECQFSFGVQPDPVTEQEAQNVPCLSRCPTKRQVVEPCYRMEEGSEIRSG